MLQVQSTKSFHYLSVRVVKYLYRKKHRFHIYVTRSGRITDNNALQQQKASSPIDATPLGIVIETKLVLPIDSPLEITTDSKLLLPEKLVSLIITIYVLMYLYIYGSIYTFMVFL